MDAMQLPPILQGKVNQSRYPDKRLAPSLVTILSEAAHFNPSFTYVARDTHYESGVLYVGEVNVYEKGQPVGVIGITERYGRSGSRETVYVVRTEGLKKQRSDSQSTKHLRHAVRTIKQHFKPKPLSDRAADLRNTISNKIDRMVRNADAHVESSVRGAAHSLLSFLISYDSLATKPSALPLELTAKLSKDWRTYIDNLRIAKSVATQFAANNGAYVRIEEDGNLSVLDMQTGTLSEHSTTYELPIYYQEKITMLKIMDENQPIEHVGARFESYESSNGVRRDLKYFFLVDGETVTNC